MRKKTIYLLTKIFIILNFLIYFIFNIPTNTFAYNEPEINSEAAIVIDVESNSILYSKAHDVKKYPASTTKILTAIIVIENSSLDELVTMSQYSTTILGPEYSSAGLKYGEILTVEQLLQLMLVHSANDAAIALAEHIAGTESSFVSMMNAKVYELELANTNFVNSYGGHDDNQYTTAYDLSQIMRYCIENETFRRLAGSASCSIPATNKSDVRQFVSTNSLMVADSDIYYPTIFVGKTGFTTPAGFCLVSAAYENERAFISVVLNSVDPDLRFLDTTRLYNYTYSKFSEKTIIAENQYLLTTEVSSATNSSNNLLNIQTASEITALISNDIDITTLTHTINIDEHISAPIFKGDKVGTLTYEINGTKYSTDLIASNTIEPSKTKIYLIGIVTLIISSLAFSYIYGIIKKRKVETHIE